jgi:hypothetical protein
MSLYTPTISHAQQLIGSYVALLSETDHFNSNGQRLTSAAAIIRQDRANPTPLSFDSYSLSLAVLRRASGRQERGQIDYLASSTW